MVTATSNNPAVVPDAGSAAPALGVVLGAPHTSTLGVIAAMNSDQKANIDASVRALCESLSRRGATSTFFVV